MWNFVVALLVGFGGVLATAELTVENIQYDCEQRPSHICRPFAPDKLDNLPTKEDVLQNCPAAVLYATCIEGYQTNCGYEGAMYQDYPTEEMAGDVKNVLIHFCDPETELHKAIINNYECIADSLENALNTCGQNVRTLAKDFKKDLNVPDVRESRQDLECLVNGLFVSCISTELDDSCGEEVKDAFVDIIQRLRIMEMYCSGVDIEKLHDDYDDVMELSPEHETLAYSFIETKK